MNKKTLAALLRQDFYTFIDKSFLEVDGGEFVPNWHIEVIAHHLSLVEAGKIKRLLINLPPRSLKSHCASVAFPAWVLGRNPDRRVICASYGQDLAVKHAIGTRKIMESAWFKSAFPGVKFGPKQTETLLSTGKSGGRLAVSVGGPMTGFGGNIILVDDPMKVGDANSMTKRAEVQEWYSNTLYSRLDNKAEDAIVIVMQRLHEDDLTAYVKELEEWTELRIPAIAEQDLEYDCSDEYFYGFEAGALLDPVREPEHVLRSIEASLGSAAFSAQYLQAPVPKGGNLFKWQWFKPFDLANRPIFEAIVQSWDTASSIEANRSYSVCTTWGFVGAHSYLIDIYRRRLETPDLVRVARRQFERFRPHLILIEIGGPGLTLHQYLRDLPCRLESINPEGDKVFRAEHITPALEKGEVWVPNDAPWLEDFHNEIIGFPAGRYSDQVDSMTQVICYRRALAKRAAIEVSNREERSHTSAPRRGRISSLSSNQVLMEASRRWNGYGW